MPLIQVNHQHDYAPNADTGFGKELLEFCRRLPANLVNNTARLWLDVGTSESDVQVAFHEFERFGINTTGVQFRMEFTEQLNDVDRSDLRTELAYQIMHGLAQHITAPDIALDIYAGAWCGALIKGGKIVKTW